MKSPFSRRKTGLVAGTEHQMKKTKNLWCNIVPISLWTICVEKLSPPLFLLLFTDSSKNKKRLLTVRKKKKSVLVQRFCQIKVFTVLIRKKKRVEEMHLSLKFYEYWINLNWHKKCTYKSPQNMMICACKVSLKFSVSAVTRLFLVWEVEYKFRLNHTSLPYVNYFKIINEIFLIRNLVMIYTITQLYLNLILACLINLVD